MEPEATTDAGLSKRTTPTWEMELLVSAGTIFGLLQLPSVLDRVHSHLFNSSSEAFSMLLSAAWVYSKMTLFIVIATFAAHLCLRAYWVALVGMDSVYPGGIRWDKMRMGPIARELSSKRARPMRDVIEAADNRATRVFGTGFGAALLMVFPIFLALLGLLVAWLVDLAFGPSLAALSFYIVFGTVLLPLVIVQAFDRRLGIRFADGGLPARVVAGVLRPYRWIGLDGSSNLLIGLFASHEGNRRAGLLAFAFFTPVLAVLIVSALVSRGQIQLGNDAGWPLANPFDGRSVVAEFYASQRGDAGTGRPMPFIPDRVVSGPYLELFVPFVPRRHAAEMAAACPDVLLARQSRKLEPDQSGSLSCLARLSAIQIDARPVPVTFESSTDPRSGQRGMLAMLPMDGLASGRHELSLAAPSREGKPAERYRIAFWK